MDYDPNAGLSNGNSWNGATFVLSDNNGATVATGTLTNGSLDTLFFCIPDGCYYMDVSNSSNPNDSSHWSVIYNGVQVAFETFLQRMFWFQLIVYVLVLLQEQRLAN